MRMINAVTCGCFAVASALEVWGQQLPLVFLPTPTNITSTRDPNAPANSGARYLSDLQFYDGKWLLGDGFGGIWHSSDAMVWEQATLLRSGLPVTAQNNAVRSINRSATGTYLATFLGGDPSIARSTDGYIWHVIPVPETCAPHFSATNGTGTWIVPGCADRLLISTDDGLTWMTRSTGLPAPYIEGQGYKAGVWVTGAGYDPEGGTGPRVAGIYYSTDLITWTKAYTFPRGVRAKRTLLLNGQLFMLGGGRLVVSSNDGVSWTQRHYFPLPLDPLGERQPDQLQAGAWFPEHGYFFGGESRSWISTTDFVSWKRGMMGAPSSGENSGEVVGMAASTSGLLASGPAPFPFIYRLGSITQ